MKFSKSHDFPKIIVRSQHFAKYQNVLVFFVDNPSSKSRIRFFVSKRAHGERKTWHHDRRSWYSLC
jgi:hypothetical protein